MSHIPNSAMPHAEARPEAKSDDGGGGSRFGQWAEKVREHPKTAAAAGAAMAAGIAAAAAIPAIRARRNSSEEKSSGKNSGKRGG